MSEDKTKWFKNKTCKLLNDFHNPGNEKIGEEFDAQRIISTLLKSGIDTVTFFSKDNYGYSYYDTKIGVKHPGLDFDCFGALVKEAKKNNMRVMVYHALNYEYIAGLNNVDWIVAAKDGTKYVHVPNSEVREYGSGKEGNELPLAGDFLFMDIKSMRNLGFHFLCVNSPYIQELFWPQLKEIATNFDIDGFFLDMLFYPDDSCYCAYCQKEMSLRGIDIENKAAVHKFKEDSMFRVARETTTFIRSINPNIIVGYDNTSYLGCYREKDYNDYWVIESQPWNFGYTHAPMHARYLRNTGVPFEFMATRFHHMWGDFGGLKHINELKFDAATTIANGGVFQIGHQMPNNCTMEKEVFENVKECSDFVKERAEYCVEATPVGSIAVYAKEDLPYSAINRIEFFTSDRLRNFQGATKLLIEAHQQFDLVDDLMELDPYRVLIIPEVKDLSDSFLDKVRKFVKEGGVLIASDMTSFYDDNFKLADVLGVDFIGTSPYSISYVRAVSAAIKENVPNEFACYANIINVRARENTDILGYFVNPLFEKSVSRFHSHNQAPPGLATTYPIATVNEYGKGKAVYIAMPIFSLYFKEDYYVYRTFLENILNMVYPNNVVKQVKAPRSVEINLMEQKDRNRIILHLINCQTRRHSLHIPRIEDVYPVNNIEVKLEMDQPVKSVKAVPDGDVSWECKDGILELKLSELNIHNMVIINV